MGGRTICRRIRFRMVASCSQNSYVSGRVLPLNLFIDFSDLPRGLIEFDTSTGVVSRETKMRTDWMVSSVCLLLAGMGAWAQSGHTPVARPISSVKLEQDPDVKCLRFATESGDPDSGPSTHILEFPTNCSVPWHYHTAEEQLMVVQGQVMTEMEGGSPTSLGPGGFALMPSKEKHQFSCKSQKACRAFVYFDRAYDIFWVKDK